MRPIATYVTRSISCEPVTDGHTSEPSKNKWTNRDALWEQISVDLRTIYYTRVHIGAIWRIRLNGPHMTHPYVRLLWPPVLGYIIKECWPETMFTIRYGMPRARLKSSAFAIISSIISHDLPSWGDVRQNCSTCTQQQHQIITTITSSSSNAVSSLSAVINEQLTATHGKAKNQ